MKRSTLCWRLFQRRRYLLLIAALILLLPLYFVLPGVLWMLLASPVLLLGAMALLWQTFSLGSFGPAYQRTPKPADALAETILVDADLVDAGLCVQAVAQPVEPQPEMSLRMGSGALLLGTAMTLLSDELPESQRAAVHMAVAKLNIRPDRLKAHSKVLLREQNEDYTAVTVQDGLNERTYFLAEASSLAKLCNMIWEDAQGTKGARSMNAQDRERICDAAAYLAQGGCEVLAYATSVGDDRPTFLGLCGFGQRIRMEALQELSLMKGLGLTIMLREVEDPTIDTASLRRALDIPDIHARPDIYLSADRDAPVQGTLTIRPVPDQPLSAPVLRLREQFGRAEAILTRFICLLATLLCCCLLAGTGFSAFAVTAVMLCGAWCFGLPQNPGRLPPAMHIVPIAGAALLRLFLGAALPGAALGAGGMLCVLLAFPSAMLLYEGGLPPWRQMLPVGIAAAVLSAAAAVIAGTSWLAALLAVLFAAIIALVCWLIRA